MSSLKTNPPEDWLSRATRIILEGGLVALPFERLFGIAGDAENPQVLARIITAKGRNAARKKQPISVVGFDLETLSPFIERIPKLAQSLIDSYWPGPVTILLPAGPNVPEPLVSDRGLIGVRVPGASPSLDLARATGRVLTATSANPTGGKDVVSAQQLRQLGLDGIDMIVDGTVPGPPGSTVVDASGRIPRVLRPGIVKIEAAGRNTGEG